MNFASTSEDSQPLTASAATNHPEREPHLTDTDDPRVEENLAVDDGKG